ncbi:HAD-IA family hydrolase [Sulfitobacter guttiformis]|uniref:HAD superfamily hydrolase (TIGR01509 family) n=1 Tax=Sulfitobacter guttiformis TaxID=74349 RepID=A0A420DHH1_9RHOB|nr:HAD-IA family hydrolase [Sulfitobacter guttiformis]KIN72589.1 haloacid dehalogenase-like family protein [Sulfitobacter guttiformis KCTC 32187]RKE93669.1 HAD superfamily hydrolase (TIGR01509 family) [Sulfitobacter guttiformis]
MKPFDLVIFDCDGVLIDSEPLGAQALAEAITAAGHQMTQAKAEAIFSGSGAAQTRLLLEQLGLEADAVIADADKRLSTLFAMGVAPVPGIEQVLRSLTVQICVASNSSVDRLAESLCRTPLAALFGSHIYSASHVARSKPAPDLALHCLAQIGTTADRSIFVDDNIHGIGCARAAGILSIGFVGLSDHRPDHARTLRAAGADHVVHGAQDLDALLTELTMPAHADHLVE